MTFRDTKWCPRCSQYLGRGEFNKRSDGRGGGLQGYCKGCMSSHAMEWAKSNPERSLETSRVARYGRFGYCRGDFDRILESQGGACAICGSQDSGVSGRSFHIDHCRETGRVRGVLCHGCNTGIGAMGESAENLIAAVAYIESHKASCINDLEGWEPDNA